MSPHKASTLVQYYCMFILIILIMCNVSNTNGVRILLAMAQQPAVEDGIGGLLGGGQRAQQVMQCFTGCGQEIVGCGVTCTLGSSQSIEPCFMDCGLSNFVCMNGCFQPSIPPEDDPSPSPSPSPSPGLNASPMRTLIH